MTMEYGEGTVRINQATTYFIKRARYAKRKWGLTDAALELVLKRVTDAERLHNLSGCLKSCRAISENVS